MKNFIMLSVSLVVAAVLFSFSLMISLPLMAAALLGSWLYKPRVTVDQSAQTSGRTIEGEYREL